MLIVVTVNFVISRIVFRVSLHDAVVVRIFLLLLLTLEI
jgi:hypothetical protein